MQTEPILTETIASIQDILGADLDRITVECAVVGLFFTGVKLDTGVTGACATPLRSIPDARAPLLGKLRGRLAGELLKEVSGIRRAVPVGTENLICVDDVRESPKLTRWLRFYALYLPSWSCPSRRGAGSKRRMRRSDIS